MALTSFMNLDLPEVTTTLGPEWATMVNDAFDVIDEHDHSSGKGVKVKANGLDINADLNFTNTRPYNILATKYTNNGAALTGATYSGSVSVAGGNLYYTNTSGTAIQITSGGSVVSTPTTVTALGTTSINTDVTIGPADTFVMIITDTTAAREITLPLASAVAAGRMYIIKDKDGLADTNNITISAAGSDLIDGSASSIMSSNYGARMVVGDGVSKWYIS
jgi:hypothetical protein